MKERSQAEYTDQAQGTLHDIQSLKKQAKADLRLIKSLIGTFVFLLAAFSVFAAQTFAYFTDSSNSSANQINTGSLEMSIMDVNDGGSFDWSAQPINIMPASVFTYGGVGVQNSGNIPVYIRIKVEKTIIHSEHEISPGWEDLISCNFMANNETLSEDQRDLWIYHEGYYYYKIALVPGDQTTSLFDKVLFSPAMGNEFKNSSIQFTVICQAVQSGGNSPDPTTAWGWPDGNSLSQ